MIRIRQRAILKKGSLFPEGGLLNLFHRGEEDLPIEKRKKKKQVAAWRRRAYSIVGKAWDSLLPNSEKGKSSGRL